MLVPGNYDYGKGKEEVTLKRPYYWSCRHEKSNVLNYRTRGIEIERNGVFNSSQDQM